MNFFEKALILIKNIIFPQCCLLCGKTNEKILCKECKHKIEKNAIYCINNRLEPQFFFESHIYIFKYKNEIRNLVLNYKFNDKSYLYKIFSEIIINNKKIFGILKKYDIIIPVPIHKERKKQRGYNQSELIAEDIALKLKIDYSSQILIKYINTKEQSSLKGYERWENIKNAYKVIDEEKIIQKKIILVDDVYTTGSTVNECAKILKECGAKEIIVLTIAKD